MKKPIPKRKAEIHKPAYSYGGMRGFESDDLKEVEKEAKQAASEIMRKVKKSFLQMAA